VYVKNRCVCCTWGQACALVCDK